ncbi:MAG: phosphoribosylformylglycinamidine synthase subunit PurS [Crenarchaeota archaeon]|nr:phosphoribosylformylglycinamidine synthase subunit PurS [Thermoproteota archaeon]
MVITSKKGVRDPEGEAIHRQLVLKKGYDRVKGVRAGKYLLFLVDEEDPQRALSYVRELCEKLRIYNPVVHDIEVRIHS